MASMQIWTDINFSGTVSQVIENDLENLGEFWNDKTSSFKIYSGEWELWSNANFNGVALRLGPGEYPDIRQLDPRFNDVVSSLRAFVR